MDKVDLKNTLIKKINNSYWWHVTPHDDDAYKKRGKFLASTYNQAQFYGRPNNEPERVNISKPIFGFSEIEILTGLFGESKAQKFLNDVTSSEGKFYGKRINLDHKMFEKAKKLGFDSIVLMTPFGLKALKNNRKPDSIELNLINYN